MNLLKKLSENDLKLLENIGICVEDKDYDNFELRGYEMKIEQYIFGQSMKNGDFYRASEKYTDILNIIINNNWIKIIKLKTPEMEFFSYLSNFFLKSFKSSVSSTSRSLAIAESSKSFTILRPFSIL